MTGKQPGSSPEFVTTIRERGARNIPLLLLHGSSGTDDSLAELADAIAPQRSFVALRGPVPWEGGYAFFRRNPDRSLDTADLAGHCRDICDFLRHSPAIGGRKPVLVGYSNGAIMAAAILAADASLTSGAILLRPLSTQPETPFPPLQALPVLVLAAEHDTRRHPADAPTIAAQLVDAGADTEFHILPCGHGLDEGGADVRLARAWLDMHSRPKRHHARQCIRQPVSCAHPTREFAAMAFQPVPRRAIASHDRHAHQDRRVEDRRF